MEQIEREHLERSEMKLVGLLRLQRKRRPPCVLFPWAVRDIGVRGVRRQFENILQLEGDCLLLVAGIAQHEDSLLRRPRSPSVDLEPCRIAADPVCVFENVGIGARPLGGFGEVIPVGVGEQGWGDVHLLELGAGTEVRMDLVAEIVAWILVELLVALRKNHAVEHQAN